MQGGRGDVAHRRRRHHPLPLGVGGHFRRLFHHESSCVLFFLIELHSKALALFSLGSGPHDPVKARRRAEGLAVVVIELYGWRTANYEPVMHKQAVVA